MAQTTWGQRIRTGLGVTLVTVLVWLYAEAQAVVERREPVQVVFVPAAGQDRAIEAEGPFDPQSPQVLIQFRGSTRQLAQVRELFEQGPIPIEVPGRGDPEPYQQPINVRDELMRSRLGELGVNIVEATPHTITLHIEPLATESMPVRVLADDLHLASPPQVEPETVEVTLPRRLAGEASLLAVTAHLDELDLSQLEVDVEQTIRVPLSVPEAIESRWTRIEPRRAQVTLTLREQTGTIVKERISIQLLHSPVLLRQYSFDVRDEDLFLHDVELVGPVDVLEQVQAGDILITATVSPSFDRLEEMVGEEPTDIDFPVDLNLPPDVSVATPLPEISVTVTRHD